MDYEKEIIAIVPHYWGRGRNKAEARTKLKAQTSQTLRGVRYFEVPAGTQINDMGSFVYYPPKGKTWKDMPKSDQLEYCTAKEIK